MAEIIARLYVSILGGSLAWCGGYTASNVY